MSLTYQEFLAGADKDKMILQAVDEYARSSFFFRGLTAKRYFLGENEAVREKTITRPVKREGVDEYGRSTARTVMKETFGNRIGSGVMYRVVCQQVQYLLQNGVYLSSAAKARLGEDFDHDLQQLAEKAIVQGVAYAFWNGDHMEVLEAAVNDRSGFFTICDEVSGEICMGIQFAQASQGRSMFIRVMDENGVYLLRREKNKLAEINRWPYAEKLKHLPIVPLWGRGEHTSILTPALKSKIDAYDRILSDFADNLDRANDVFWVLNNFSGTPQDMAEMLDDMHRLKVVACMSDGSGATAAAEPRTIEVPYAAREKALQILQQQIYADAMALNPRDIAGGSLTNVAIRTACANLELQTDRFEWQVEHFISKLLRLLGTKSETIRFQRQTIANETETSSVIRMMREDIDRQTALRLYPLLQPEDVARLVKKENEQEDKKLAV